MNDMQKGVITLVKSAITQEALPLPEGFSIDEAYDFIIKHKIMMLAYDGAVRCGIPKDDPIMQKLFQNYIQGMIRSEKQMKAVEEIYSAFDANGIDYLPLKGCNMKALYPKPELRLMGDADILIREEQYHQIKKILREMGYKERSGTGYHFGWEADDIYLEIHTELVSRSHKKFSDYYLRCWEKAVKKENHRYFFSKEDEFIYALVHFTKHYTGSGIGIRHVADIFIYLRSFGDMNFEYIDTEFRKLGIAKFYNNIKNIIDIWFFDKETGQSEKIISDYILECGNWGNEKNLVVNVQVKSLAKGRKAKKNKLQYYIETIFIPLDEMQSKYKFLRKAPLLLPVFWILRWGEVLIFRSYRISQKLRAVKKINEQEIKENANLFEISGIDIY